jgi:hypothetical protein
MSFPKAALIASGLIGALLIGWVAAVYLGIESQTRAPQPPTAKSAISAAAASLEYVPTPIGASLKEFDRPMVTNVHLADLDQDGLVDVLYGEGLKNSVRWIRQSPRGIFTETILAEGVRGPAHISTADLMGSGRLDVLIASMGQISPSNDRIGAVVVLENLNNREFRQRVLIDRVARVTDVRAANLSGHTDGRVDLVVGQFGYAQGETRWMENKGNWEFESHVVNSLSGCIHTPVADFDGDGRPDFAALISQEWEEIQWFRNLGEGKFASSLVWGSTNEDYGSSGLEVADLNRDGRPDLICTNGDAFDYGGYGTRAWHGVQWLENQGGGKFEFHRVSDLPGAYGGCAADLNGDGFLDLIAVSCFADWTDRKSVSMMAWLNDGHERFSPVILANRPTHLVTVAVGDIDGNGIPVIVTGGFHAYPPFDDMSVITLWRRK